MVVVGGRVFVRRQWSDRPDGLETVMVQGWFEPEVRNSSEVYMGGVGGSPRVTACDQGTK